MSSSACQFTLPATSHNRPSHPIPRNAWIIFALTVALMLSDYMTRSVITGVLPDLKALWALNDSQLGVLVSIVPLIVGITAWPIALMADRWGYVRSVTLMGAVWCLATILCGVSQSHAQMLMARAAVGLGEAGYGSVGGAVLSLTFPSTRISAVLGAFQAAAVFGAALGVIAGGVIGAAQGWRSAFIWVGAGSLLLVALFPLLVREPRRMAAAGVLAPGAMGLRHVVRELLMTSSARFTYLGSGLQIAILAVIAAWMPSFLAREYGLPADQAGLRAGVLMVMAGAGMIVGGLLADRAGQRRRLYFASAYTFASFALLTTAFAFPAGPAQMALLLAGATVVGAHAGISVAVIIDVTHPGLRATAIATLALSNNLLGLAPGPYLAGAISDATSLRTALMVMPTAGILASACFLLAGRTYARDLASNALRGVNRVAGAAAQ
ncbi:MAG: MFS transporter [Burkholderiaceae bacterium]